MGVAMYSSKPEGKISSTECVCVCVQMWVCRCVCVCVCVCMFDVLSVTRVKSIIFIFILYSNFILYSIAIHKYIFVVAFQSSSHV